jgi:hypothetical protein
MLCRLGVIAGRNAAVDVEALSFVAGLTRGGSFPPLGFWCWVPLGVGSALLFARVPYFVECYGCTPVYDTSGLRCRWSVRLCTELVENSVGIYVQVERGHVVWSRHGVIPPSATGILSVLETLTISAASHAHGWQMPLTGLGALGL